MARKDFKEHGAFEELTDEKKGKFKRNLVVKTPLARINTPRKKTGPKRLKTPRQMLNGINSYFAWCEDNDRTPSIKGMMLHMRMQRESFYRYMEYPEYTDIMEQAKLVITEWVENDIYRTPGQAAGKIAYAKNIHGWADKIDTTSVNENRNTTILSVEDAKAKIASLAHLINPELLESLSRDFTRKQLGHIDAEVMEG